MYGVKNPNTKASSQTQVCCPNSETQEKNALNNPLYVQSKICQHNLAPNSYVFLGINKVLGKHDAYNYQLSTGQRVVVIPKKGPTVVKTYVNVGSMNEPDHLRGISHYIEHNLFNGTDILAPGEFFKKVSNMGANTNASTSFSLTDYYISSQLLDNNDLEEKIKLHSDMLQNPKFDVMQLEKERGPVVSEISMVLDNPLNLAINTCVKNLFNIESKSVDVIAGSIKNINEMTQADVKNYYDTWYTPDNRVTVVTGEVEPTNVIGLLAQNFNKPNKANYANRKYENLQPIQSPIRNDIVTDKATASHIVMGFAGPKNNANLKENLALEGLSILLNSDKNARLYKALEPYQASASFSVERMLNHPDAPTAVFLNIECAPEKTEDVLKTVYKTIHEASYNKPTISEQSHIKNKLKRSCDEINESSNSLNALIGNAMLDGNTDYIANADKAIDYITADDISNVAKKYLDLNKVSIAVVKPEIPKSQPVTTTPPFKGAAKKTVFDPKDVQLYELSNNIQYLVLPNTVNTGTFLMSINSKKVPTYKPAANIILSSILGRGSANMPKNDFYELARNHNIDINFDYEEGTINVAAKFPEKELGKTIAMTKDVLLQPDFSEKTFNTVKTEIKQRLKCARKTAQNKLQKELFPNLGLGHTIEDVMNNIDKVTIDDVKTLYTDVIQNGQTKVGVSAPQSTAVEATGILSSFPKFKKFNQKLVKYYSPINENKVVTDVEPRHQAEIIQAYKFQTNRNAKDQVSFELMNLILGGTSNSRLFNDLREKQKLAYRVRSGVQYEGDTGVLKMLILTTTDNPEEGTDKTQNVKKSLNGFKNHTDKMMNELCSDKELEQAKKTLKNSILNITEASDAKLAALTGAMESPYGINNANMKLEIIDTITPQDIQNAARHVFNSKSITSILASEKTISSLNSKS